MVKRACRDWGGYSEAEWEQVVAIASSNGLSCQCCFNVAYGEDRLRLTCADNSQSKHFEFVCCQPRRRQRGDSAFNAAPLYGSLRALACRGNRLRLRTFSLAFSHYKKQRTRKPLDAISSYWFHSTSLIVGPVSRHRDSNTL